MLVEAGALISLRDAHGRLPEEVARGSDHAETARFLSEASQQPRKRTPRPSSQLPHTSVTAANEGGATPPPPPLPTTSFATPISAKRHGSASSCDIARPMKQLRQDAAVTCRASRCDGAGSAVPVMQLPGVERIGPGVFIILLDYDDSDDDTVVGWGDDDEEQEDGEGDEKEGDDGGGTGSSVQDCGVGAATLTLTSTSRFTTALSTAAATPTPTPSMCLASTENSCIHSGEPFGDASDDDDDNDSGTVRHHISAKPLVSRMLLHDDDNDDDEEEEEEGLAASRTDSYSTGVGVGDDVDDTHVGAGVGDAGDDIGVASAINDSASTHQSTSE